MSVEDGFNYIFDSPQVFGIFLALLTFSIIYIYGIINIKWNNNTDKKLKISFFSGKKADDSTVWIAITAALAAYGIFLFEILYGSITTPVFVRRYSYPVGVAIWLGFSMLLMNVPAVKLRKCLYVLLAAFLIFTYWPSFSSGIFNYFQQNKATQESVKRIETRLNNADKIYIFTDIGHLKWTVLKYYFPEVNIDSANANGDYYFEKGTHKIFLVLSKELDNNQINKWENNLRAKVNFISKDSIAYYKYFLYEIYLTRR